MKRLAYIRVRRGPSVRKPESFSGPLNGYYSSHSTEPTASTSVESRCDFHYRMEVQGGSVHEVLSWDGLELMAAQVRCMLIDEFVEEGLAIVNDLGEKMRSVESLRPAKTPTPREFTAMSSRATGPTETNEEFFIRLCAEGEEEPPQEVTRKVLSRRRRSFLAQEAPRSLAEYMRLETGVDFQEPDPDSWQDVALRSHPDVLCLWLNGRTYHVR